MTAVGADSAVVLVVAAIVVIRAAAIAVAIVAIITIACGLIAVAVGVVPAATSIAVIATLTTSASLPALPIPTLWRQAMKPLHAMLSRSPDSA